MTRFDKLLNQAKGKRSQPTETDADLQVIPEQEPEPVPEPQPSPPVSEPAPVEVVVLKPEEPLAKSKDPNYQRSTVYLPKEMHHRLKLAALQDGKEISGVIEELVKEWLEGRDV